MVGKLTVSQGTKGGRRQKSARILQSFPAVSRSRTLAAGQIQSEYIANFYDAVPAQFPIPRTAKWVELGLTAETLPYKCGWTSGIASSCFVVAAIRKPVVADC